MRRGTYSSNPEHEKLVKPTWSSIRRLVGLAAPYKWYLAAGGALTLLSSATNLSLPWIMRFAINRIVEEKSVALLDRFALIVIGVVMISALIGFGQYVLISYAGNRIVTDVRARLFSHLLRLPVTFFDRTRSGDLTSHLSNDVSLMQQSLGSDLVTIFGQSLMLIGCIFTAVYMNARLTAVVVGLLLVVMLGFVISGRRLRKLTRSALDALSETMGTMTEALANIRLVKAFVREPYEGGRADERLEKVFNLNMKASISEGIMGTVAFAGFITLILGVLWFGGRSIMSGHLTWGDLAAFLVTIMFMSGPMSQLASLYTRLQRAVGASDRIFAILDDEPEIPDPRNPVAFPIREGTVTFQKIEFRYVPETPVLNGLALELPAGKVTALVGASGGGKTTIASLLYRFYEPQSGQISIDDVPIVQIRRDELREHIGLVPQDTILFNGTIRENIRYGRLGATEQEVEEAAKAANVHEFVQGFADGYDTVVGERGVTLSGGQRQRVAIARALLKNPRILILDEATSALDAKSEALVREALDRLMKGRTTLVIAHRLTTIQNADQIAVLEGGQVVELGTHRQLLERGGRYSDLHLLGIENTSVSP